MLLKQASIKVLLSGRATSLRVLLKYVLSKLTYVKFWEQGLIHSKYSRMLPVTIFSNGNHGSHELKTKQTKTKTQKTHKVFSPKSSAFRVLIKYYLTAIKKVIGVNGIIPERKGLEEIILSERKKLAEEIKKQCINCSRFITRGVRTFSLFWKPKGNLRM